jgi:hypothetical protein
MKFLSAILILAAAIAIPAMAGEPTGRAIGPNDVMLNGMAVTGDNSALPNGGRPEAQVPFPEIRRWKSLVITLDRGACFGTCPIYRVAIHGDGRVVFEGGRFVARTGTHQARISRAKVRRLFAKFRRAKFFWLHDEYRAHVTDIPEFKLSIAYDDHGKTVIDYGGGMIGMPEIVSELERAVDTAANTQRWIKGQAP